MEDLASQILTEVREMRERLGEIGERVARVEAGMHSLLGNGQPGWMHRLQARVDAHEVQLSASAGKDTVRAAFKQIIIPLLCSAIGAATTLLVTFLRHKP